MNKIKEFSKEEMALFSEPFLKSPSPTLVRNDEAWKVLTSSEEFGRKVMRVDCASGAFVVGYGIKRGIIVYRYDIKDEVEGTPINVDLYSLDGSTLSKIHPSFPGHRLASLPE
ncbi:hypothetical protein J4402_04535 [Candidatus Pacearchaeota archaeon]|nr:hypothetical protein [Candidatus Pacearchaeota archaeon]